MALEKSCRRLLSVKIDLEGSMLAAPGEDEARHATITRILSEMPRIEELGLFGDFQRPEYAAALSHKAPNLKTLALHGHDEGDGLEIPAYLFQGDTTSIRHLSLAYMTLHTQAPDQFVNLTQLHLYGQQYNFSVEFESLLDFLDSIAALEELIFTHVETLEENGINPSGRHAHVPRLRRLSFQGLDPRDVGFIISSMQLPPESAIIVASDVVQELGAVFGRNGLEHLPDIKTVHLAIEDTCDIYAAGKNFLWHMEQCLLDHRFFRDLASAIRTVTELWVDGDALSPSLALCVTRMFASIAELERLVLSIAAKDVFLVALTPTSEGNLCPLLADIDIHGISDDTWDPLVVFLTKRDALGMPIRTLRVFHLRQTHPTEDEDIANRLFRTWKARRAVLEAHVETVTLEEVIEFPQMTLPPICEPGDGGYWPCGDWVF